MIHAFILYGDGTICTTCNHETLGRAKLDDKARLWVDLDQPDDAEFKLLADVFHFHPLAIEDTTGEHDQRAKLERYNAADIQQHKAGYFFMVFHAPDLEVKDKLATKELDLFIGERFLVTVHKKRILAVEGNVAKVGKDPKAAIEAGLDLLLHQILDQIVDAYFPILDKLQERIDHVEDLATDSPQRVVLKRINKMKRELLGFRRTIAPQRDVLNSLTRGEIPFIHEQARVYIRDVQDHLSRVVETVELYRDLISGARDVYLSSLSNNLNQVMKTLTIITVIALPLTVVTGFFGMNFEAIPGLHSKMGFWLAVTGMLMAVAGLLTLFWKKKWI